MKKIGLIGGISWVSTVDYYRFINEGINARLGGLQFAELLLYSLNFGDVQAKGWEQSYSLLLHAARKLQKADADAIVLCANTAHLFADDLSNETGLPVINIITETAKTIAKDGITRVGLLGTKFTMEMDFYSKKLAAYGLTVLIPEKQETRNYIQHTLKEELGIGLIKPETKEQYIHIANELIEQGAECIIMGCTEIPLLLSADDFSVPVYDTTKIHTGAIVDYMLSDSQ